jgi:hypothetical protein
MKEEHKVYASRAELSRDIFGLAFFFGGIGVAGLIANFHGYLGHPWLFGVMFGGGALVIVGHDFLYNGAINRLNYLRVAVKYLSLLFLAGGLMALASFAIKLYIEGASYPLLFAGLAGAYLGALGYYYGSRFYQNLDAVSLGLKIGFEPADSGVFSEDWTYDARGEVNGVCVLFNIDSVCIRRSKYSPPRYRYDLDILCRCYNPGGIKFQARKPFTRLFFLRPGALLRGLWLPPMDPPQHWEGSGLLFRSNSAEAAARCLYENSELTYLLGADASFLEMSLKGWDFQFSFSREHQPWSQDSLRSALDGATRLAAAFSRLNG